MQAALIRNVTAVAIGGRALLIEGPPGSGKTSLALALIDRGAQLIGDDGVAVEAAGGFARLSPPRGFEGLIEVRGVGLVTVPAVSAPAALVLALGAEAPRLPDDLDRRLVAGVPVPLLAFRAGDAVQALRAEYALEKHGLAVADRSALANTSPP